MKRALTWLLLAALPLATSALAHVTAAQVAREAGFEQRLAATIPGSLVFRDEHGTDVHLSDYYGAAPIVLVFAWYGCSTLCPTVVGNLAHALEHGDLARADYQVVVVSIDPRDAPADALRMKRQHLATVRANAWHLLSGGERHIAALAQAAGFRYAYDEDTHQYAHPAGVVVLTPRGTIARYFLGFDYTPAALREGLDAAARGEIGSPVERLLLVCFHFLPSGRYSALVLQTLRIASVALALVAVGTVLMKRRRVAAR
jgi:protein SCO1/2